jgi:hypothetical protein
MVKEEGERVRMERGSYEVRRRRGRMGWVEEKRGGRKGGGGLEWFVVLRVVRAGEGGGRGVDFSQSRHPSQANRLHDDSRRVARLRTTKLPSG